MPLVQIANRNANVYVCVLYANTPNSNYSSLNKFKRHGDKESLVQGGLIHVNADRQNGTERCENWKQNQWMKTDCLVSTVRCYGICIMSNLE